MSVIEQIACVLVLGILAQWVASLIRLPSILLLLLCGVAAGPVLGFIDSSAMHSGALEAIVSLSVGVILFEGGLTLRFSEARSVGRVVGRLVSVGVLVSWMLGAGAAWMFLDVAGSVALLLGAILVLSGPTVVAPLLRFLRPKGATGPILKWEGIVIDPVGALLAVLVFDAVSSETESGPGLASAGLDILQTAVVGGAVGFLVAKATLFILRRHWVPDVMQAPVTLGFTLAAFVLSNELVHEAGLLATTLMGFMFANQREVSIHHITVFKEHLTHLLIPSLFVLLASRLSLEDLADAAWPGGLLFLATLLFVVRPASVWISTLGLGMSWRDRVFLSWMFPRGIVAAAVAPFFALELVSRGVEGAEIIVPIVYLVIIGTVAIYGLTAGHVARWLGVTQPSPQGVLIVGASELARAVAKTVQDSGFDVAVTDTNRQNVARARLDGLRAYQANIVSEDEFDRVDLGGLGRMLALTPNDEVNTLAVLQGTEVFGRAKVFRLAPETKSAVSTEVPLHLRGRIAFGEEFTYSALASRLTRGYSVKRTSLSDDFTYADFLAMYGESAVPLFRVSGEDRLHVIQAGDEAPAGEAIISLVDADLADKPAEGVAER